MTINRYGLNPLDIDFAAEIRAEMGRQKMELKPLCEALGLSVSAVSNRVNARQALTIGEAHAVANALGKELSELLVHVERRQNETGVA